MEKLSHIDNQQSTVWKIFAFIGRELLESIRHLDHACARMKPVRPLHRGQIGPWSTDDVTFVQQICVRANLEQNHNHRG